MTKLQKWVVIIPAVITLLLVVLILKNMPGAGRQNLAMNHDIILSDGIPEEPKTMILSIVEEIEQEKTYASLKIDYPLNNSIFPPDIVAPTFLWHDDSDKTNTWLINIEFKDFPYHIYVLTGGKRPSSKTDPECTTENNVFYENDYQSSAKAWKPEEKTWNIIKHHSKKGKARISFVGLGMIDDISEFQNIESSGSIEFSTSMDPVGAPIFYRDVPLMPSETEEGVVKPLSDNALPLIQWRLRDISEPSAPVVMKDLPTCANCHSFSRSGKVLGMDMDGPQGDKGAYALANICKRMIINKEDVFSWNNYNEKHTTFGLFSRVSPDGRFVVSAVNEEVFVANYMDYKFLQTFYPTRGILAVFSKTTGEIKKLPGADNPEYVHCNPVWSPDGKTIVFLRATAKPAYIPGSMPQYANDPKETPIRYDLYSIPFNGGNGGTTNPVQGASNNGMSNSFPKFSPDGKWLVFVKCKNGLLMRPDSKLYIMPAQGGEARKMTCNTSLMNSWHSWSPNSRWLVFSSKSNTPYTQMFLTHIDQNGYDSPAILIPDSTAANRAVNLPEFVSIRSGDIEVISTPAVDYRRHLDKSKELILKGLINEAFEEVKKSLELKSDYPDTYSTLSYILDELGKTGEAIEYYKKAIRSNPLNDFNYINLGVLLNQNKEYTRAISCFSKALEINPKLYSAYYNWGISLANIEKHEDSLEKFRKAIKINPKLDRAYYQIGRIMSVQSNHEEAIKSYNEALKINPDYADAYHGRGSSYSRKGKHERGLADYDKSIQFDPSNPGYYKNRGIIHHQMRETGKAIADYNEALKLDPNYAEAFFNRGNAYLAEKNVDRAILDYTHALQCKPPFKDAFYNRCIAYSMKDDFRRIVADCTETLNANPEDNKAYIARGNAYFGLKEYKMAISDNNIVLNLHPENIEAHYNKAICHEMIGNKRDMQLSFINFLKYAPPNSPGIEYAKKKIR